ncbi:DHA2 family efflux MFS transporter permease subunit [Dyella sp. C9]|uniref:DHA2 family efflux MFS transporter permease subunit n=1 Tax=Dyella sp. C9 TaxID=2202154 RepID=UPI000DF00365|nr:DHA2 family efflux MFS transporter permease subunit [Dyella sp. C9]
MQSATHSGGGPSFWLVAPTVAMAAFMEVLDISIANVALQHIAGSLSASQDEATWVLTSYLVANAVVLPITGWLSTVIGRKRLFLTCIGMFGIASLICGAAPTLGALVLFRALQGLAGGGLQPIAQSILQDAAPPAQRGMAFALYGIAVVFAPAIGPTLGGWITDHFSWRWVFLINVPISVLLMLLAGTIVRDPAYLTEEREKRRKNGFRVDGIGFALLALGLGAMQVVLDRGQQNDWMASPLILSMTLTSVVALLCFVVWELGEKDPIVDIRLLGIRNFAIAFVLMFALGFVLLATTLLIPQLTQTLMGYTATAAGLVISPGGIVLLLCMPIIGRLVTMMDPRLMIAIGFAVGGAAMLHMTNLYTDVDAKTIAIYRIYQSLGLAFLFVPINTIAMGSVPRGPRIGNATALVSLARNLGGSFGTSLVTTLLARRSQQHQSTLVSYLSPGSTTYQDTVNQSSQLFAQHGMDAVQANQAALQTVGGTLQQQASLLAYLDNFKVLGLIFLTLVPLAFFLRRIRMEGQPTMAH